MLERVADVIEPTLLMRPPNLLRPGLRDLWNGCSSWAGRFSSFGAGAGEAIEILTGAARPILDRWFESEQFKATLATDAIIGAMAAPSMPGTAYVLFHHVMGETNGKRGVWGYVRGGMGGLTQALAKAAAGARRRDPHRGRGRPHPRPGRCRLRRGPGQRRRDPRQGRGQQRRRQRHVQQADRQPPLAAGVRRGGEPHRLRQRLAEDQRRPVRAAGFPRLSRRRNPARSIAAPSTSAPIRTTSNAATTTPSTAGRRERPILECTIPSVVDPIGGAAGQASDVDVHPVRSVQAARRNWDELREPFADRCFDLLNEYAPNFKRSVIARQVLTPLDLERTFNLTGGNIFQGAMTLNQLFFLRPVVGYAGYRTPMRGLYLCGAAAHPGGGVIGAAGWNAAKEILGKW